MSPAYYKGETDIWIILERKQVGEKQYQEKDRSLDS